MSNLVDGRIHVGTFASLLVTFLKEVIYLSVGLLVGWHKKLQVDLVEIFREG